MTKRGKKLKASSVPTMPYTPTAQERAAIDRVLERQATKAPSPRFKKIGRTPDNVVRLLPDHPDLNTSQTLLADALGTGDHEFSTGLLGQLMTLTRSGKTASKEEVNFILSQMRGIDPRDETEALLATQMVAIHNATMVAARRLMWIDNIPQQDSASNMLNKLARTFATQVEALKKYRSAGEQTIKVQHVTVNDGGQAIVGNVSRGGGGGAKNGGQPHGLSAANACGTPLLSHEQEDPFKMPSPGGSRLDGVPVSRREGRSAKGQS
jgi:hypothetical protein